MQQQRTQFNDTRRRTYSWARRDSNPLQYRLFLPIKIGYNVSSSPIHHTLLYFFVLIPSILYQSTLHHVRGRTRYAVVHGYYSIPLFPTTTLSPCSRFWLQRCTFDDSQLVGTFPKPQLFIIAYYSGCLHALSAISFGHR